MIYAKLHILTSVVCFISGNLLPADLSMVLFIHLSFIYSLSCYYYVHIVYIHVHLPLFLHTHWVTFLRPWICTPDIGCFISLIRCWWARTLRKDQSFSLFDSGILISLLFIIFPDSLYIIISCRSIFLFIYYHVWMIVCDIAVTMIYYCLDL